MNPLAPDLDHVLAHTQGLWEDLRGQRLFITGGTGFFGCWLLETFAWANERLSLASEAVVLTRNPGAFRAKAPHLARNAAIRLHPGDVRDFPFPAGPFSYCIHAAAESNVQLVSQQPLVLFDTHLHGAWRVFSFARDCNAKGVLFTSSGAVYGKQPADVGSLAEDYAGGSETFAADPVKAANAGGIGAAELVGRLFATQYGLPVKIARCFTFVGPCLPLTKPFAATSFLRDALRGGPIQIGGDGTTLRSYLYAADLMIWLWTILLKGQAASPYNVGSETPLSIKELAETVARLVSPASQVTVRDASKPGQKPDRYLPSTRKARTELGLQEWITLPEAIERTAAWHRLHPQ